MLLRLGHCFENSILSYFILISLKKSLTFTLPSFNKQMFESSTFNGDLSLWNTGAVTNMAWVGTLALMLIDRKQTI